MSRNNWWRGCSEYLPCSHWRLAAVGLYSGFLFGGAEDQRVWHSHRFGSRAHARILKIAFSSAAASVGSGIAVGLVLTLALSKVLARWAEGSSRDPMLLLAVTALLALVATVACCAPAKKAVGVDPMTALRYE